MSAANANDTLADLRLQRQAEHLHALGPRTLYEFIAEIGAACSCRSEIDTRLTAYARITPEMLRCCGGDRMPPRPMVAVSGYGGR
jgi:hypothetical protein